eukprot:TRINITY_DN7849_c0_g1_i10.p2 TRINITY_DN7849_c0_g1~~TRINITY_DN7849_c0_g1_i10.p2  ORF type:complete len:101 (-),score=9.39 TRINITY_DN7849_c0_g1_i10:177-479(-)
MDELEGKGSTKDPAKSQEVVRSVFSLLLSVCLFEATTALATHQKALKASEDGKGDAKESASVETKRSGVLSILQNLQKHLLARAGCICTSSCLWASFGSC